MDLRKTHLIAALVPIFVVLAGRELLFVNKALTVLNKDEGKILIVHFSPDEKLNLSVNKLLLVTGMIAEKKHHHFDFLLTNKLDKLPI